MATALAQLSFDYGDLPATDAKALERHAESVLRIQERQRKTTAENVWKLGEELKAAQDRLSNHGNGTFGRWCVERCGMSPQHARQYIAVYDGVKSEKLETHVSQFDFSALRELFKDTCPEEALADAVKAVKKGAVITHKRAKEIIAAHTVNGTVAPEEEPQADDEEELASFVDLGGDRTKTFCALCDIRKQWPAESWQEFIAVLETVIEETRNAISD